MFGRTKNLRVTEKTRSGLDKRKKKRGRRRRSSVLVTSRDRPIDQPPAKFNSFFVDATYLPAVVELHTVESK